jgi:hypothetical protein
MRDIWKRLALWCWLAGLAILGMVRPAQAVDYSFSVPFSFSFSSSSIVSGVKLGISHGEMTDSLFESYLISYTAIENPQVIESSDDDPEYEDFTAALVNDQDDGWVFTFKLVSGATSYETGAEADYTGEVYAGNGIDFTGHTITAIEMLVTYYNDSIFVMPPIFFTSGSMTGVITIYSTHPDPCQCVLEPSQVNMTLAGGTRELDLLVSEYTDYCYWPVRDAPDWLHINAPEPNEYGGTVVVTVDDNTSGFARRAVVRLGEQELIVRQPPVSNAGPGLLIMQAQ